MAGVLGEVAETAVAAFDGPAVAEFDAAEVGNVTLSAPTLNSLEQNLLVCEPCLFLEPNILPQYGQGNSPVMWTSCTCLLILAVVLLQSGQSPPRRGKSIKQLG